jgi:hypothetical protein
VRFRLTCLAGPPDWAGGTQPRPCDCQCPKQTNKPSTRALKSEKVVCSTQVIAFFNVGCHTAFHLV